MLDWLLNPTRHSLRKELLGKLRSLECASRVEVQSTIDYYASQYFCHALQGRNHDVGDEKKAAEELTTAVIKDAMTLSATDQGKDRVHYKRESHHVPRGFCTGLIFIRLGENAYARLLYMMEWD